MNKLYNPYLAKLTVAKRLHTERLLTCRAEATFEDGLLNTSPKRLLLDYFRKLCITCLLKAFKILRNTKLLLLLLILLLLLLLLHDYKNLFHVKRLPPRLFNLDCNVI